MKIFVLFGNVNNFEFTSYPEQCLLMFLVFYSFRILHFLDFAKFVLGEIKTHLAMHQRKS